MAQSMQYKRNNLYGGQRVESLAEYKEGFMHGMIVTLMVLSIILYFAP